MVVFKKHRLCVCVCVGAGASKKQKYKGLVNVVARTRLAYIKNFYCKFVNSKTAVSNTQPARPVFPPTVDKHVKFFFRIHEIRTDHVVVHENFGDVLHCSFSSFVKLIEMKKMIVSHYFRIFRTHIFF